MAKPNKDKDPSGSKGTNSASTSSSTAIPSKEETLELAKRFKELYPAYKARHDEFLARGMPLSEQEKVEIGVMRGRLVMLKTMVESGAKLYEVDEDVDQVLRCMTIAGGPRTGDAHA